jgi:hypothetical protein
METIGTFINNLQTKFEEKADDEVLLNIANAIIAALEQKTGKVNKGLIPTLAYQNFAPDIAQKQEEIKEEKFEPQQPMPTIA